jgi:hypothetical protein
MLRTFDRMVSTPPANFAEQLPAFLWLSNQGWIGFCTIGTVKEHKVFPIRAQVSPRTLADMCGEPKKQGPTKFYSEPIHISKSQSSKFHCWCFGKLSFVIFRRNLVGAKKPLTTLADATFISTLADVKVCFQGCWNRKFLLLCRM